MEKILSKAKRLELAKKRIRNTLATYTVACLRTLENKISDAGPFNQRIDPHIITTAKDQMLADGELSFSKPKNFPWFHLPETPPDQVKKRLATLQDVHDQFVAGNLKNRIGQALEIAVYRSLGEQSASFFGRFDDLDDHDDATLYHKVEPPNAISDNKIPDQSIHDFTIFLSSGPGVIEVKNIRHWIYPDQHEVRELLYKAVHLDAVPILIARRIQYSTFRVLQPCGLLIHQTYNQRLPQSASDIADLAKNKNLLGYHDIQLGNQPDKRLNTFIHKNLPTAFPSAHERFRDYFDLTSIYATGGMEFAEFAARVRRREAGTNEDFDY